MGSIADCTSRTSNESLSDALTANEKIIMHTMHTNANFWNLIKYLLYCKIAKQNRTLRVNKSINTNDHTNMIIHYTMKTPRIQVFTQRFENGFFRSIQKRNPSGSKKGAQEQNDLSSYSSKKIIKNCNFTIDFFAKRW